MNWTEGSLARHSRGRQRNALLLRQKQHFAKVRNNMMQGNNASQRPIVLSFDRHNASPASSHRRRSLAALRRNPASSPSMPANQVPLESKSRVQQPVRSGTLHTDLELMDSDRRRKLLSKSDWTGLSLPEPEPLKPHFPGQFYAERRWGLPTSRMKKASRRHPNFHSHHVEERLRLPKRSRIKVQIGSQEIHPSIATVSQVSTGRHKRLPSTDSEQGSGYLDSSSVSSRSGGSLPLSSAPNRATISLGDRSMPSISEELPRPLDSPAYVSYASVNIHEPAPRRQNASQVLEWSDSISDVRGSSMEVEIERPVRPVPSSQESEQKRWRDFVRSSDDTSYLSPDTHSSSMDLPQRSATSLKSVTRSPSLPSQLQPTLPSIGFDSPVKTQRHLEFTMSDLIHLSDSSSSPNQPVPKQDGQGCISTSAQRCESAVSRPCLTDSRKKSPPRAPVRTPIRPQAKKPTEDELNMSWMRFAYGDDDEDSDEILENAFKEAAHQAAKELRPSDTSDSTDVHAYSDLTQGGGASASDEVSRWTETLEQEDVASVSHVATQGTATTTAAPESILSNVATDASSNETSDDKPHFTIPKRFQGKHVVQTHANTLSTENLDATGVPATKGRGRGRKKKRAMDGRPDIRGLPYLNADDDPIEDSEVD